MAPIRDLPENRSGERQHETNHKELPVAYIHARHLTRCYLIELSQMPYALVLTLHICHLQKGFHIQNHLTPSLYFLLQVLKENQK